MLEVLLRILTGVGTQVFWVLVFCAVVIGTFVLIFAIAALVAIFTSNIEQRKIAYLILRALLRFFRRGGSR
jgi:hypothetical protein